MQLFNDFCNYTLDENGVLNSFQLNYPENYNFGYDVVDKMGELAPNDIAMEWTNPDHLHKTFTFADIKRLSNKAANAFKNQGVKKGDRVIVILKRNYEYWYIVPALHKLGAIVIPATNMLTLDDITYRVDTADIRFAVSTPDGDTAETLVKASKERTILEKVFVVRRDVEGAVNFTDEIEKADPQVITLLLQVLDDGRLTDGQGNTVDFKNTVIIATSNAGFGNERLTGDEDKDMKIMDRIAPYFRPEFLNRFNAVIEFSHLTKEDLNDIVDLMLTEVNQTIAKKGMDLEVTDAAKAYLIEEGYDEAMGVRPLRRVIEQQIRDRITDYYLDHLDSKHLLADLVDDTIVISERQEEQENKD